MKFPTRHLVCVVSLIAVNAWAWSNHTVVTYRALEAMPEVINAAPVTVEALETFLKGEEKAIASLLIQQETWARANISSYAARPDKLTFRPNPARSDTQRRLDFLTALRVAPDSRFALFVQPDPRGPQGAETILRESAVSTLPENANASPKFVGINIGDHVPALAVVASASDEPDYGLDINLWEDSPSEWGKVYGLGKLPFGNPALSYSTQAPLHMGFYHQDWLIFKAAPFVKRTLPMLRVYQYSTLASLAFQTGHPYWGWRFAGLALHYVQDLTQPYHASLAPGNSSFQLISANTLAMAGWPRRRDDLVVLLSNRHLALEKYQRDMMLKAANAREDTAMERALRNTQLDRNYGAWSDLYLRDVVAREAYAQGEKTAEVIIAAMPRAYISDPTFDFGVKEDSIALLAAMDKQDSGRRAALDAQLTLLLSHFGAHSRNALRGILKNSAKP